MLKRENTSGGIQMGIRIAALFYVVVIFVGLGNFFYLSLEGFSKSSLYLLGLLPLYASFSWGAYPMLYMENVQRRSYGVPRRAHHSLSYIIIMIIAIELYGFVTSSPLKVSSYGSDQFGEKHSSYDLRVTPSTLCTSEEREISNLGRCEKGPPSSEMNGC